MDEGKACVLTAGGGAREPGRQQNSRTRLLQEMCLEMCSSGGVPCIVAGSPSNKMRAADLQEVLYAPYRCGRMTEYLEGGLCEVIILAMVFYSRKPMY